MPFLNQPASTLHWLPAKGSCKHGKELGFLQNKITAQRNQLNAAVIEFDRVNSMLHVRDQELGRSFDEIAEKDKQIQRLTNEVDQVTLEVRRLLPEPREFRFVLESIEGSLSWKITRPIRRVKTSRAALTINTLMRSAPERFFQYIRGRQTNETSFLLPLNQERDGLFDAAFYREKNLDVVEAGIDPFQHYILHGAAEGRDPHPLFDTSYYCEMNPDVVGSGINPLNHYLSHGAAEGRDPHPLFDT